MSNMGQVTINQGMNLKASCISQGKTRNTKKTAGSVIRPSARMSRASNKPISIGRTAEASFMLRSHFVPTCECRTPALGFTARLSSSLPQCGSLTALGKPTIQSLPLSGHTQLPVTRRPPYSIFLSQVRYKKRNPIRSAATPSGGRVPSCCPTAMNPVVQA